VVESDSELHQLIKSIIAGDGEGVSRLLAASPQLAQASFQQGATRQSEEPFFLDQIGRYIYAGDTALHIAAAAYQTEIVSNLLSAGAYVHARNRRGQEALHAAACGSPGSPMWNPSAQAATPARAFISTFVDWSAPGLRVRRVKTVTPLDVCVDPAFDASRRRPGAAYQSGREGRAAPASQLEGRGGGEPRQ